MDQGINNAYRGGTDRYRRGGARGGESFSSRTPYERTSSSNSSHHPHDHQQHHRSQRDSRPRRIDEVYETDELLSEDQYSRNFTGGDSANNPASYLEYVRIHRRHILERFFNRHKSEPWFLEIYDPFKAEGNWNILKEEAQMRAASFIADMQNGIFNEIFLEEGTDLNINEQQQQNSGSGNRNISYPASMKLPTRLQGLVAPRQNVIALSNISPQVTKIELTRMLQEITPNFRSLEMGFPNVEKANYRLAWAIFEEDTELAPIVSAIEEKIMHGEKIYCAALKSFSLQIKTADPLFSKEDRLTRDLEQSRDLQLALDAHFGISSPSFVQEVSEKRQLDLSIAYLRRVHFICYYSGIIAASNLDLIRQAGDICVRNSSTEIPNIGDLTQFDENIADLKERLIFSYPLISEDTILEKHVGKVEDSRFRCVHCNKLFKGPEFVVKHLRLKHEEVSKVATLDTTVINALFLHPLPSLVPVKGTRRTRSPTLSDRPIRDHQQNYRDRPHQRGGQMDRNRRPPPPPRDAAQDPRQMRQYVDWDAPATGDVEISYD